MNVVARLRHVLARRPWLYWTGVALFAIGVGAVVASASATVDEARRAWGEPRSVVVATVDLEPGDALAASTETRDLPAPMTPDAALATTPRNAVARQHISAGEVVVAADVTASAAPRGLIPDGWSAVAVAEAVPTGVVIGDAVRAVADGVVLADEGVVVGHAGEGVLVAVPDDTAPGVALAAATGTLALLIVP